LEGGKKKKIGHPIQKLQEDHRGRRVEQGRGGGKMQRRNEPGRTEEKGAPNKKEEEVIQRQGGGGEKKICGDKEKGSIESKG